MADCIINDALESDEEDSIELIVDCPFPVDTSGFKNPHSDVHSCANIGIFPLLPDKYPIITGKFLHLHCEVKDKPKKKQSVFKTNYFKTTEEEKADAKASPDEIGSMRVR